MEKLTRRDFNKKVVAGVAGMAALGSGILPLSGMTKKMFSDNKRPNFVFILPDQHNAKYLGFMGHPFVRTPNLDKLAAKGIFFKNNYCGNPVCTPSRASLMTGMYASDVNSFGNSTVYDGSYPTWAKRLRDSGYYCWATGTFDLNPKVDLGFVTDDVDNYHSQHPDITALFRRPVGYRVDERKVVDGKSRETKSSDLKYIEKSIDFIKNKSVKLNKPWVCYVSPHMPHPPFIGLKKYYDYYLTKVEPPEVSIEELEKLPLPYQILRNFKRISTPIPIERRKRALAAYCAMIQEVDDYVGELYKAVEESGQLDNTYFIYTSDHGESAGEHGLWLKNNLYGVAARVPLVISGPKLNIGKSFEQPTGHIDMVATMMELAGLGKVKELRGTSLMPMINGQLDKAPEFVYTESHSEGNCAGSCSIRKGDWRLLHFSWYEDVLFNIKDDPDEKNNLIDNPKYKDKVDELKKLLYSKVNPEEITDRAFNLQNKILNNFADTLSEDKLDDLFKSRLGEGEAKVLSRKLKGISFPK